MPETHSKYMCQYHNDFPFKLITARRAEYCTESLGQRFSCFRGSRASSPAVFGVPPKTPTAPAASPIGEIGMTVKLAGETPARATVSAVASLWRDKTA